MNRRLAIQVLVVIAAAVVTTPSHIARADAAAPTESAWARTTPKPDLALANLLIRSGKTVFDGHCRTCHAAASSPATRGFYPGTYALEMRYQGKLPAALEERTDLTAARVIAVVRHGGGGFMPPLRPTELNDDELRAVAAYLSRRNPNP
jgi:mono/diheme cytochrome c family protein